MVEIPLLLKTIKVLNDKDIKLTGHSATNYFDSQDIEVLEIYNPAMPSTRNPKLNQVLICGTGNNIADIISAKAVFENPTHIIYDESVESSGYFCSFDPCSDTGKSFGTIDALGENTERWKAVSILPRVLPKYRKLVKRRNKLIKTCKNYAKFYKLVKLIKE